MRALIERYIAFLNTLRDFPLLFFRLILAYGFAEPAYQKLKFFENTIGFFTKLGIPFPTLNAYMATTTECLGVIALALGLGMRFITIPLMFVMLVAIKTVHLDNGFACGKNGFEVPFYYFFMLFCLLVYGAGKLSVDHLIARKKQ